ncbi:cell filamentation protein Fic [Phyllobacterium phragmitis]|uniref:Cell filamentation protein Fic n=1 Tax=Phyllobacterium phragmitis TaxID=2670329 RepID=A0A2S9IRZ8_9HYPH|nr:Fic family protein [Phyllobacterium phragmitis]PRD43288.1 cell filamentation protein Fic [Phyllobacterium phragmitis]
MTDEAQRHSVAFEAEIIKDPLKKAEAEARNGLKQYDYGMQVVQQALDRGTFKLRVSVVLALQREALAGISAYAGNFRPAGVEILGSKHKPVEAHLVAERVEEMCDYVNDNWSDATAIHLASYIMWRLNWIHPFSDGNGRTSRILSYVVLCIKTGSILPGTPAIPEQIVENRNPYFAALDAADAAFANGKIDLSVMEELLSGMLAVQLRNAYEKAGGRL